MTKDPASRHAAAGTYRVDPDVELFVPRMRTRPPAVRRHIAQRTDRLDIVAAATSRTPTSTGGSPTPTRAAARAARRAGQHPRHPRSGLMTARPPFLKLWLDGVAVESLAGSVLALEVDERADEASTFRIVLDLSPIGDGTSAGDWDVLEHGPFAAERGVPAFRLLRRVSVSSGFEAADDTGRVDDRLRRLRHGRRAGDRTQPGARLLPRAVVPGRHVPDAPRDRDADLGGAHRRQDRRRDLRQVRLRQHARRHDRGRRREPRRDPAGLGAARHRRRVPPHAGASQRVRERTSSRQARCTPGTHPGGTSSGTSTRRASASSRSPCSRSSRATPDAQSSGPGTTATSPPGYAAGTSTSAVAAAAVRRPRGDRPTCGWVATAEPTC